MGEESFYTPNGYHLDISPDVLYVYTGAYWVPPNIEGSLNGYAGWCYYVIEDMKILAHDKGQLTQTPSDRKAELMAGVYGGFRAKKLQKKRQNIIIRFENTIYYETCAFRYYYKWIENDWHTSKGTPLKYKEWWKALINLYLSERVNIVYNQIFDDTFFTDLCKEEAKEMAMKARSGFLVSK